MALSRAEASVVCEPETFELAVVVPLFLAGFAGHELYSALLTVANSIFVCAARCVLRLLIKGSLMLLAFYGVISACVVEPMLGTDVREWSTRHLGARKSTAGIIGTKDSRRIIFQTLLASGGAFEPCAICLDQIKVPLVLPCAHVFCVPCISRWSSSSRRMSGSATCPCCRNNFDAFLPCQSSSFFRILFGKIR